MRYFPLVAALLICTACSAQNTSLMGSRVKPHNAEQELQAHELQGGEMRMGHSRMTVLSNVQIAPAEVMSTDAQIIAHVAGHTIRRQQGGTMATQSPYVGAAYQHDTQDIGLISQEISIRFVGNSVPLAYQKWKLKELIANSGIYILTVVDLKQWSFAMRQLQLDSQVLSVQARLVTSERQVK